MDERYRSTEWLELSGLPAELNEKVRSGAWLVFRKIVDLECRRNLHPDALEVSLGELAERCGIPWEKVAATLEALRKKKYLSCFVPDNPDELALIQIRLPVLTPRSPEQVALTASDPYLRDPTTFRYATKKAQSDTELEKVQKVVDLYLNTLSQKLNSFIVEQIEILSQRFPFEAIQKTIERAARHEIRHIGWVAKELIRDAATSKPEKKPKSHEASRPSRRSSSI